MKNLFNTFRFLLICLWRRLLQQAGEFFTLLFSASAVFGLIIYIGSDFTSNSVEFLSSEILHKLKFFFINLTIPIALMFTLEYGRSLIHQHSDLQGLKVFSVPEKVISQYLNLQRLGWAMIALLFWVFLAYWILQGNWTVSETMIFLVVSVCALLFSLFIPLLNKFGKNLADSLMVRWQGPLRWRLIQISFHAGRLGIVWLLLVLGYGLTLVCLVKGLPSFLAVLAAFLAAGGLSYLLCFEAAKSVQWTWIEKSAGFSHANFVKLYKRLAWLLLLTHASLLTLIYALGASHYELMEFMRLLLISGTPIYLFSSLMFQIDIHRPLIQVSVLLLLAFFVSTGMFAHIAAVLLLPLIDFYAAKYQLNRYYRL